MTLTVRLDTALESALDRYTGEQGVSKSHVVQEALAEYLTARSSRRQRPAEVSENFKAFERAGLIGALAVGGGADKESVRRRVVERLTGQARKR